MGGAPHTVVVYKNAIVMLVGATKTGHTLDPAAVQRCHEIAAASPPATAEEPQAVENAVGKAIWDAEPPLRPILDLITVALDSMDVELKLDEEFSE
mmetsp:Transcript_55826/g.88563  ORF Transcript_55826/g.88563 Transcript_55826/m.88563 type:complete len:96 (+) Transcript_55826:62-349(+)